MSIGNMAETIKNYIKREVQWRMVLLEHSTPSDFYLSVWQVNRSTFPLLVLRSLLFLGLIAIIISSITIYALNGIAKFWLIYLTHWGLLSITAATGLSVAVSARSYLYGPFSSGYNLPWYVKCYWVAHNAAIPVAFLITVFYWSVLYDASIEEELNHMLDIPVHGLNSVAAFLLLMTSSVPSRMLHIFHPLILALVWVIFSAIYYAAGGVDQKGHRYVYPVVNWARPGPTMVALLLTGLLLVMLHLTTVSFATIRDTVTKSCCNQNDDEPRPGEAVPLRQHNNTAV